MSPTAYNAWRLVSLSPLPAWALALCGAAAAGAVLLAWRGLSAEDRRARRAVLVGLRALGAALAVLVVVEPGVELLATMRIRGRLAVLVDRSRSMSLPARPNGPTRADVAAQVVADASERAALARRFQVEYFGFAGDLSSIDPATLTSPATQAIADPAGAPSAPPDPSLDHTDLVPALEEAARSGAGRPLAGIVLISDGADNGRLAAALQHGSSSPEAKALLARLKALGAPVYALDPAAGALKDLAVSAVKVDDFAFVRNPMTVEAKLTEQGYRKLEVPVTLERDGQVVTSAEASLTDGGSATVKLKFVPDTTGDFAFTVRVPVQDGEAVTANNSRSFVLKVIRDRVRVLFVAGRPSWDERFLRQLLKRDPNVDLITFFILRTPSNLTMAASDDELSLIPFPTDEIFSQQLKTFDLVIFDDFSFMPYTNAPYFMDSYLPGIADYVRGGGAFLMVGGTNSFADGGYAGSPLADILPVLLSRSAPQPTADPFQPLLTPGGLLHPITRLQPNEAANEAEWSSLPPLTGINRTTLAPGAQALLVDPNLTDQSGRPLPVVAVRDVGRGRSMAVTADSTWRWAFLAAAQGTPPHAYEQFYHHAIRWLVRDPELTQVQLDAEKERFSPEEPVTLIVKARESNYGPAAGARVEVRVQSTQPGGPSRAADGVVSADGTVRVELGSLPAGPYRGSVVVRQDGQEIGRAADAFVVSESGPELLEPAPRPEWLRLIAQATGGEERPAAGAKLSRLPIPQPQALEIGQRESHPLWDRLPVLLALCLVLGSEWFLRRRWGFY